MSNIRVTYAGLIGLAVGLINIVSGLGFILILTQSLPPEEFGTWRLVIGFTVQVGIIQSLVGYWAIRETARGIESGKTAVFTTGVLSIVGIFVYLLIAYFTGIQTDAEQNILFFGVILIPAIFFESVLSQITLGWKPQISSYSRLSFGILKVPLALIMLYFFDMGVSGVFLSIFLAYLSSITILLIFSRKKIQTKIKFQYVKSWIKRAWIPLYQELNTLIFSLDVLVFSLISGSVMGLAYFAAAWSVGSFTANAAAISSATYPKLLAGGEHRYLKDNTTRLLYFAIPLVSISIAFSKPALYALNPLYEVVSLAVIFFSIRILFFTLSKTFSNFLLGQENVDIDTTTSFKNYIKSRLFFIPTVRLIRFSVYLGSLILMLFLLGKEASPTTLVLFWSIIAFLTEIPFTLYFYFLVRKNFHFNMEFNLILKYVLVSAVVFSIMFVIMDNYLEYKTDILEFLPSLLFFVVLAMGSYFLMTYFVDLKTRKLIKAIINELKSKT